MVVQRVEGGEPGALDVARAHLTAGTRTAVQFNGARYTPDLLMRVDELCAEFSSLLEVRFYGAQEIFDLRVLSALPSVESLTTNSLRGVRNVSALRDLQRLRRFWFGAAQYEERDLLTHIDPTYLEDLCIGESAKKQIDLESIADFTALGTLTVSGHTRGIGSIARVPRLMSLTLWHIPKTQSLHFLSGHETLERLEINLGGRQGIDEISSDRLKELEVVRVRGFERFPCLDRLPALQKLRLDRLAKLTEITIPGESRSPLSWLAAVSCKHLTKVEGLALLSALEGLVLVGPGLDLEALLVSGLPSSLRVLHYLPQRASEVPEARRRIEGLGYSYA